ncbi:hypothetical protein [Bradyrhizobium sp.]|jgi:hypothetical protein|uniref:hypothetical protein n=1 Tax=Bradyrhizobium sp. TaxID=376 RepID=UPI0025B9C51A|nr:hypothetical protein [Bradyrhizobium sp.]
MSELFGVGSIGRAQARALHAAAIGGPACALLIGKLLPIAMDTLSTVVAPPVAVRDLGRLPIRGRADGIDVVGIDAPAAAAA